jgi:cytochrome c-type biogenesis protein CcmE
VASRNGVRLVVALSIAAALAVFLLYTSLAGNTLAALTPSQLGGHHGKVQLVGKVLGPIEGDPHSPRGLRFRLRDIGGTATVPVVYRGTKPDLFGRDRDIFVTGRVEHGVFVSTPGSMITKCPSKYKAKGS